MRTAQKGFSLTEVLLIITAIGLVSGVGWYVYSQRSVDTKQQNAITNFDECVAAGNPVMESNPEQCSANGQTFTNNSETNNATATQVAFKDLPASLQKAVKAARASKCINPAPFNAQIEQNTFATRYIEDKFADVGIQCGDGGSAGLFVNQADSWILVESTQFVWTCKTVNTYKIPASFTKECWDKPNDKVIENPNR